MEVVLNLLDVVAVVLSLQPPPVQDGVPVLVPALLPGVAPVVPGVAGVQGGHHPVAEVGPGGTGSGNLQSVETHLGGGERGEGRDNQDLSHHDAESESGLVSLHLLAAFILSQERTGERQQAGQSEIQTTGAAFNMINIQQSHRTTYSVNTEKLCNFPLKVSLALVPLLQNDIIAFRDFLYNSEDILGVLGMVGTTELTLMTPGVRGTHVVCLGQWSALLPGFKSESCR